MLRRILDRLRSRERTDANSIAMLESNERLERALGLLDDRLVRAESLLEKSTGEVSRRLVAMDEWASHLTLLEERSTRIESLLRESVERLSQQVETVRLFASRLEPIDERSARTEAHLRNATEMLLKQVETVRLFASQIGPIDERSGRMEGRLVDLAKRLSSNVDVDTERHADWTDKLGKVLSDLGQLRRDMARIAIDADDKARDILEFLLRPRTPAVLRLFLNTERRIAEDSPDHASPRGTAHDNTRHPRLVAKCEEIFPSLRHLDLGCGGGGLVWDFTSRGHISVGIDGSDFSKKERRAEWRTIPERLFTADLCHPFMFVDEFGQPFTFTVITAWELFEHIPIHSVDQAIANVRNNLAPNGLFLCSIATFVDKDDRTGVVWHQTVESNTWWINRFAQGGLVQAPGLFETGDFVRGVGNPRADDWDVRVHPEMGFHLVLRHSSATNMDTLSSTVEK
jgi:hypothetical protein